MKKGKILLTVAVNILFISLFISGVIFLYNITGKKNVDEMLKSTEKTVYKEKPRISDIDKSQDTVKLPEFKKYHFKYYYKIPVTGTISELKFILPIPYDENEKQYITSKSFNPQPTRIYNEGDNTFAEFVFPRITNSTAEVLIEGTAKVRTYSLKNAQTAGKNITPEKDLSKYLMPEKYIQSDDAQIKSVAAKLKGANDEETVKNIYLYVNKNIEYKLIPGLLGAKKALTDKKGKCSELSALMVALCRANGIPARVVTGNFARQMPNKHSWVEVYYKDYGWVNYDPAKRATPYNKYVNGKLVSTEIKYEYDTSNIEYIASIKNNLSPWFFKMHFDNGDSGNPSIIENYEITPEN